MWEGHLLWESCSAVLSRNPVASSAHCWKEKISSLGAVTELSVPHTLLSIHFDTCGPSGTYLCARAVEALSPTGGKLTLVLPAKCNILKTLFTIVWFPERRLIELNNELCRRTKINNTPSMCDQVVLKFCHCFVTDTESSRIIGRRA